MARQQSFTEGELRLELSRGERRRFRLAHRALSRLRVPGMAPYLLLPYARSLELRRYRPPTPGAVWAVTMVKNEADIIGHSIEHLLAEGVDHVLVADNLSDDGTLDVLRRLAQHAPLTILHDRLPTFYQGEKMTRLARLATAAGAEWIIPFDADELWTAPTGRLADFVRSCEHSVLHSNFWDYVPTEGDDAAETNPFLRIQHRRPRPEAMHKVAFRANRFAFIEDGNHSVRHPGGSSPDLLTVRHFPFRTTEQAVRKVTQGVTALQADDIPPQYGVHWRALAARTDEQIAEYYRRLNDDLVADPAPFRAVKTL